MYKILNIQGLGVAGKQNELIELALTHKFSGVEVDVEDLVGRHDALGKQFACQFLQSAKIDMGTFCLPAVLGGTEEAFESSLEKLETIIDLAETLKCKRCYVKIEPTNGEFAFQENFENHQTRLRQLGETLEPHGIRIGLALQASTVSSSEGEFKFIQSAEELITLAKSVGQSSVGIMLDSWEWALGGGSSDQFSDSSLQALVTELRLADISEEADLANINKSDRTQTPGETEGSFSVSLTKQLIESGYDGSISASTSLATFAGSRERVVAKISQCLNTIIANEDPVVEDATESVDAANDEGSEAATEGEVVVAAGASQK